MSDVFDPNGYCTAKVCGVVDNVYATRDGQDLIHDLVPDDPVDGGTPEGVEGWLQVTPDERVLVRRVRTGHTICVWKRQSWADIEADLPAGLAH